MSCDSVIYVRGAPIGMKTKLEDIAREAGVNLSTASRSLSGAYGVHPDTRQRVLDIAKRLNYRPNRVARGLVTGRSQTMALVVSDIRNPFFADVCRGAEDAALEADCDLIVCNSDLDPVKQMRYIDSLLAKRVDGILMNSVEALSRVQQEQLAASGVAVVLLNRTAALKRFSTVAADNFEGGALAARLLAGLGHRATANLTGPRKHGNLTERTRGFVKTLQSLPVPDPVVQFGAHTFEGGHEMSKRLFAAHPEITAVFAANDVMAFGCMLAANELGLRIPRDLSIVGFDNLNVSQIVAPPLTTIHQPKYELGKSAMELLLRLAQKKDQEPEHRVIGVRLIERASCAPPREASAGD